MRKSVLGVFIAVTLLFTLVTGASAQAVGNLDTASIVFKPADGLKMPVSGLFERAIKAGDVNRTAKVYIPKTCDMGAYFVVIAAPDVKDTAAWLAKSGWISVADKNDVGLFVMEPEKGAWGSPDKEAAYIAAAYAAAGDKKYYLPFPTFYLVGYGSGGVALQKYAMTQGITVISAAFIDASDIGEDYLAQMNSTVYKGTNIKFGDVPVPVWIISKKIAGDTQKVVEFWKKANECDPLEYGFAGGDVFFQKENTDSIFTPKSCSKVAVLQKSVKYDDPALATMLYRDFLSSYTRYGGAAGGNTLAARPNYKALGVEFKTMTVDGYKREYMVYVPKSVKASGKSAPVLYSLHGASQTYKMMFDISRWWEVADARSFILVMPTSTSGPAPAWNAKLNPKMADDLKFLELLVLQIDKDYKVDQSRRYIGGQSNGCMMTNLVGLRLSPYFAALGATSGPILQWEDPASVATCNETIPFMMILGEFDLWDYRFTPDAKSMSVRNTLKYWVGRDEIESFDSYSTYVNNRYSNYVWSDEAGRPIVRYAVTSGRGHSIIPDEMKVLWDEWFACWQKDAQGFKVYMGR